MQKYIEEEASPEHLSSIYNLQFNFMPLFNICLPIDRVQLKLQRARGKSKLLT